MAELTRDEIDAATLRELRYLVPNIRDGVLEGEIHWRYPEDVPYGGDLRRSLVRLQRRGLVRSERRSGFAEPLRWFPVGEEVS